MTDIVEDLTKFNGKWPYEQARLEIVSLRHQLAECQAREQLRIDALYILARLGNGDQFGNSEGNLIAYKALVLPHDSTALDTILKQAKREEVLKIAGTFEILGGASTSQLRNWAQEVEV
jgi:hypothetical protein